MLKWMTEEKTRENEKPRVVLNKGLGGGGGKTSKTSLELPETLCLYQLY